MPISIDDMPLEDIPSENARTLKYDSPAVLKYADKVNKQLGLPDGLLRNTISQGEKSGPMSTSPKGAKGVAQFMPETAKRFGLSDPTDPLSSIDAMGRYYQNAQKVTKSSDPAILAAAYNSGENRESLKNGKIPNNPETKAYAARVASGMSPAKKGMTLDEIEAKEAQADKMFEPETKVNKMLSKVAPQPSSAGSAFGKSAALGVVPAAVGWAAMGAGAEAGGAVGFMVGGPVGAAVGGLVGGLITSGVAAYGAGAVQQAAMSFLPEQALKYMGLDKETLANDEKAHPIAAFAGRESASLLTFRPGVSPIKQMIAMGGLNTVVEGAQEMHSDGKLDPIKLGIAAGVGAIVSKPNGLGKAISNKTTPVWRSLEKITPKQEYVDAVAEKVGPEFKEAAGKHWEEVDAKTHPPEGTVSASGTMRNTVDQLVDAQYGLAGARDATTLDALAHVKSMDHEELALASSEEIYHSMPSEKNAAKPEQVKGRAIEDANAPRKIGERAAPEGEMLSAEAKYVKDRFINPIVERGKSLWEQAKVLGGDDFVAQFGEDHNPRVLQRTVVQRVMDSASAGMSSVGFARQPSSMKSRSMFALEAEDGTRKVINLDGRTVNGFNTDKKPFVMAQLAKAAQVGDAVNINGKAGKIVQATTAHIEAETDLRYHKNVLANQLTTNAELESYIREKQWLSNTVDALAKMGHAILKEETHGSAPKGYVAVQGDSTLGKYFIRDRIAETFQDGILKSANPAHAIERINQAAIGTMFWNPIPHLANAADHWMNSMGWDLVKPWQYKSLAKSVHEAYKDVATLSPAYRDYLTSGFGLNYGRVAAEGAYAKMIKGIPEPEMRSLAKQWGMKPLELTAALYHGSKNVLWGGSDIMMLSAYKHLSSKTGMDIFDRALRNHVEAHNPNYRIPPRVGFDSLMKIPGMPEAMGKAVSRGLSMVMQSKAFNVFGRYHYGQFKSIGHNLHDIVYQNEHSAQNRGEALSHVAFVTFSVGVVYPFLFDTMAKAISGDPSAQSRRSGASTIPYTLWHIILGDESTRKILSEAMSLPPITKAIVELPSNRNLFTGQHIWEPGDNALGAAVDIGLYTAGAIVSPIRSIEQAVKDPHKTAGAQLGIQTDTDVAAAKAYKFRQREKAAAKRKQKKRGYLIDEE